MNIINYNIAISYLCFQTCREKLTDEEDFKYRKEQILLETNFAVNNTLALIIHILNYYVYKCFPFTQLTKPQKKNPLNTQKGHTYSLSASNILKIKRLKDICYRGEKRRSSFLYLIGAVTIKWKKNSHEGRAEMPTGLNEFIMKNEYSFHHWPVISSQGSLASSTATWRFSG